ncbi:protein SHQ1 homolog [Armigeres subalbatus]|uniref:protein SHQ1 homolog n=1 Tax=Armigeres subalbatus TaxID=124917 RepID=UPI002ED2C7C0
MAEVVTYSLDYSSDFAILVINIPNLDLEQDASATLEVQDKELLFTLPPYHIRIPSEEKLQLTEVFPKQIDYEKGAIHYNIPLSKSAVQDEQLVSHCHTYGFGNFYSGALNIANSQDFKTLSNPEEFSPDQRRSKRLNEESNDFNLEHYAMDHVQYLIDGFGLELNEIPIDVHLNDDQQNRVRMIVEEKKRQEEKYRMLSGNETVCFSLVDIILAVLYDKTVNCNELNEAISHVNIHRISSSLSYFEQFTSYEDVIVAFYRRSCMYPFHRSKDLAKKCVDHLTAAFKHANVIEWMLEKFLYCYDAFKSNDCVVLNHYYIKDCIKFVQLCSPADMLNQAGSHIKEILPSIHNRSLGFGEEAMVRKLINDIIGVDEESTDSDDTSGSDDESSDTESDSSDADDAPLPDESVLHKLMNLKIQM